MGLTPDFIYYGESVCSMCDTPMVANDHGITYRAYSSKNMYRMFCIECAVKLVMSVAQDIDKLPPEIAFRYYEHFNQPIPNMLRHAKALNALSTSLSEWAEIMSGVKNIMGKELAQEVGD